MNIDMNHKYQTRDGRAVRILAIDEKSQWSVVGRIMETYGRETLNSWMADGKAVTFDNSPLDLIPVPTKHEGFIVVGKDGFVWGQNIVSTIGEAIEAGFKKEEGDHIVRVTWED